MLPPPPATLRHPAAARSLCHHHLGDIGAMRLVGHGGGHQAYRAGNATVIQRYQYLHLALRRRRQPASPPGQCASLIKSSHEADGSAVGHSLHHQGGKTRQQRGISVRIERSNDHARYDAKALRADPVAG
jgi:hypothetical protein